MMRCPTCGNENIIQGKERNTLICNRCRSTFFKPVSTQNLSDFHVEEEKKNVISDQSKDEFNFDKLIEAIVLLKTEKTEGVGFIISEQGHVLTNAHVLDGAPFCFGQRVGKSKIIEYNVIADGDPMKLDICLLEPLIEDKFTYLKFSNKQIKVGQTVYTIGNPKGLGASLSKGFISQIKETQIQLDMTVNPGNSGGPVLDGNGEVIGMISYLLKDVQGLGFAVNLDAINKFIENSQ